MTQGLYSSLRRFNNSLKFFIFGNGVAIDEKQDRHGAKRAEKHEGCRHHNGLKAFQSDHIAMIADEQKCPSPVSCRTFWFFGSA